MRLSIATLFIALPSWLFAQGEKNFIDQNYIEVTGKAEMSVTPDMIYLKIVISEKDTKNRTSVEDLEKQMVAKLEGLGINLKEDLAIQDLTSNFRNYFLSRNEVILSKVYQLLVHNSSTAVKVFAELEKVGISNINIDRVDHTKIEQYRSEVKVSAAKATKEKARLLAKAMDQDIGRALYIQESDISIYNPRNANVMVRGYSSTGLAKAVDLDVEFEKIKLEYSVMARFELK